MRLWNKRVKYEERNRALGLCVRSQLHGRRDARSKNLCADCLTSARKAMSVVRARPAKLLQFPANVAAWREMRVAEKKPVQSEGLEYQARRVA